jgi:uncharacterized transporter YbjL
MKRSLLIMSFLVFIFALVGLCICLWKLYVLEKGLFILLGGISLALIMTTYLNTIMKYYLSEKEDK